MQELGIRTTIFGILRFLDNVLDDVGTTELMKMYKIQQDRRLQDVGKNNFGHLLIDFCISQRLLIVNGRVGRGADLGNLTCKNASLVDYVIASPCVFPCICDFYVGDFVYLIFTALYL